MSAFGTSQSIARTIGLGGANLAAALATTSGMGVPRRQQQCRSA